MANETLKSVAKSITAAQRARMTMLSVHSGLCQLAILNDAITTLEKARMWARSRNPDVHRFSREALRMLALRN